MQQFLGKSTERRLRLEKERQEMTKIAYEQSQIKESLQGRLDALNERESQLLDHEVSQLKAADQ